jgi:hypothetical protein
MDSLIIKYDKDEIKKILDFEDAPGTDEQQKLLEKLCAGIVWNKKAFIRKHKEWFKAAYLHRYQTEKLEVKL